MNMIYIYYVTNENKQTEQQIEMVRKHRQIMSQICQMLYIYKCYQTLENQGQTYVSSTATHQASPAQVLSFY